MNELNLLHWKSLGQIPMLKPSNANKQLAGPSVQIFFTSKKLFHLNFSLISGLEKKSSREFHFKHLFFILSVVFISSLIFLSIHIFDFSSTMQVHVTEISKPKLASLFTRFPVILKISVEYGNCWNLNNTLDKLNGTCPTLNLW